MYKYMFSIVVPVYQAQIYLEECICSVLIQSEQNWELILVDDGSTDDSSSICDRYAVQYENIQVIHTSNKGPISARCSGYQLAEGKYLINLDADDRLTEDALCIISQKLAQSDVDLLIFNYRIINAVGAPLGKHESHLVNNTYCGKERSHLFSCLLKEEALNLVWNKVFKTSMVQKSIPRPAKLLNIKSGDDIIIVSPLLAESKRIRTIQSCLYEYRMVETSITHQFLPQKGSDFVRSREYMLKYFRTEDLVDEELSCSFKTMIYRTVNYLAWNCAKSNKSMDEKIQFFKFLSKQEIYLESLFYAKRVKFRIHKQLSVWLFRHKFYRLLVFYEIFQAKAKKMIGWQ